jgi:hypothetical protein
MSRVGEGPRGVGHRASLCLYYVKGMSAARASIDLAFLLSGGAAFRPLHKADGYQRFQQPDSGAGEEGAD